MSYLASLHKRCQPFCRRVAVTAVVCSLVACREDIVTPSRDIRPSAASASVAEPAALDSLARGLALALNDANLRMQLHDDFRDSPFDEHGLHLSSYLQGGRGRALMDAVTRALGTKFSDVVRWDAAAGGLELALSRPIDRLQWDGTVSVVVASTTMSPLALARSRNALIGFDSKGQASALPVYDFNHQPLLMLRPVRAAFGETPEATRASAPRQNRAMVSTRDEEERLYRSFERRIGPATASATEDCGLVDYCDPGSGGTESLAGILLPAQFTQYYCKGVSPTIGPGEDVDHDGVRDDCEAALAQAFSPRLMRAAEDEAPQMEPYFSVASRQPDPFGYRAVIKIFYALGYYRDPGSPGLHYDAHDGDSEWIILGVHSPGGSYWKLDYETLSAHWGSGGGADHTATYGTDVIEWADITYGKPQIWVSANKHANYRSRAVCMYTWNDMCGYEYNYWGAVFYIPSNANLGNYWAGTGDGRLITSNLSRAGAYPAYEFGWWKNAPYDTFSTYFAGWHTNTVQTKATAYGTMLNSFGF
jgi:hypothetical protein